MRVIGGELLDHTLRFGEGYKSVRSGYESVTKESIFGSTETYLPASASFSASLSHTGVEKSKEGSILAERKM